MGGDKVMLASYDFAPKVEHGFTDLNLPQAAGSLVTVVQGVALVGEVL